MSVLKAVMALFTALTYQAQVFVALAGVLAANIAFDLRTERRSVRLRDDLRLSLRLLGPILAGGAIGGLLAVGMVSNEQGGSASHAGLLAWRSTDAAVILENLVEQVVAYATGRASSAAGCSYPP